jgi:hypothetical protein
MPLSLGPQTIICGPFFDIQVEYYLQKVRRALAANDLQTCCGLLHCCSSRTRKYGQEKRPFEAIERPKSREEMPKEGRDEDLAIHDALHNIHCGAQKAIGISKFSVVPMDCGEKQKRGPFEAVERPKSREETPKEGCGRNQAMTITAV